MLEETALTVGELNHRIEVSLASIGGLWVRGEIENINRRRDNCWYFNLAGENNQVIKAKVWGPHLVALRTILAGIEEGSQVEAFFDRVDYYGPHGSLALDVRDLKEQGDGTLLRARQAILERLAGAQ
jgi:exonuclease VII large subunit